MIHPLGTQDPPAGGGSRSAMFVDFDNVYSRLRQVDPAVAERFAREPVEWLKAVSNADAPAAGGTRRFLMRNCYLNPEVFSPYRKYWARAGFRVMDCPSLTMHRKSSADIHLVLDAMDVLLGDVRIDEFFIASPDADFTALVQRLRAKDRRTTLIVTGAVASAYSEMADAVIHSLDALKSLGGGAREYAALVELPTRVPAKADPVTPPAVAAAATITGPAADAVRALVRHAPGPLHASAVAGLAASKEPALVNGWAGRKKFGVWVAQIGGHIG
ncbi:NYN domain-containing protein [Arthrobacter sp. LAPM80]|uniref:NYN domain-containing protein n=1 Tax=Arthrobacter sp. LAPM80 TaxID=3141788 RepID=UPI00398B5E53